VLWHPDLERVGDRVRLSGLLRSGEATLTREAPAFAAPGRARAASLAHPSLADVRLKLAPTGEGLTLYPGEGSSSVRVGLRALEEPRHLDAEQLRDGVVIELSDSVILLVHDLPSRQRQEPACFGLLGGSEGVVEMRAEVRRVADLDVPVLLCGETGTGKELMARAIHRRSRRRKRPYLAVNPAAIPPSLAASELFGAAKGAFTGAVQRQAGYFARAHGGTIFLDEIGEASPEVQAMLLRVLSLGEIQPVGVQETQEVDVRVLAASDLDLRQAAVDGRFRTPLFHRLANYQIQVPTLRARRDDIGRLLVAFLQRELRAVGEEWRLEEEKVAEWLPASVVARLACYRWPGNVRQLENTVRQLVIGSRGASQVRIGPQLERLLQDAVARMRGDTRAERQRRVETVLTDEAPPRKEYRNPAEVDEEELVEAMRRHHWTIKLAAEDLGVSRTSLYALIDRSPAIKKAADLGRREIRRARDACDGDLLAMSERLEVSLAGLQQRLNELGERG
jgi:two-component system, NtrC family, nitrogen regulation response regulator GlnG